MKVYDFDGTIYNGDSALDFYLYCLKRHPRVFAYIFKQLFAAILYICGRISTKEMKEQFFSFLKALRDTDELVELFWNDHKIKIKDWYLREKQESDLIISASPEFLLRPLCSQLKVEKLIATKMDITSGKILGKNCKGVEKVRRFFDLFPNEKIQAFYSDSQTDAPLAKISERAFFVNENEIYLWEEIVTED